MATATTPASQTRATQTRRLRRVVEVALAAYDVRPVRVRRLPRGWNATFGVQADDGSRFALRVHRPGGPGEAEVRSELAWLAAVAADTDLVVPRPRPTRDGDRVVVVDDPAVVDDGPRVCDLLRWVDGHFVDARLTPAHLRTIGTLMADLPSTDGGSCGRTGSSAATSPGGPTSPGAATTRSVRPCSTGPPTRSPRSSPDWDLGVVRATVERARAARDAAAADGRVGLLHADLHHENVLFGSRAAGTDGTVPAGVIDFDDCGDGPDAYDPAVMVTELWRRPDRDRLRAALLEGWAGRTGRAVESEEVDAMEGLRHLQLAVYGVEHRTEPMFAAGGTRT